MGGTSHFATYQLESRVQYPYEVRVQYPYEVKRCEI